MFWMIAVATDAPNTMEPKITCTDQYQKCESECHKLATSPNATSLNATSLNAIMDTCYDSCVYHNVTGLFPCFEGCVNKTLVGKINGTLDGDKYMCNCVGGNYMCCQPRLCGLESVSDPCSTSDDDYCAVKDPTRFNVTSDDLNCNGCDDPNCNNADDLTLNAFCTNCAKNMLFTANDCPTDRINLMEETEATERLIFFHLR